MSSLKTSLVLVAIFIVLSAFFVMANGVEKEIKQGNDKNLGEISSDLASRLSVFEIEKNLGENNDKPKKDLKIGLKSEEIEVLEKEKIEDEKDPQLNLFGPFQPRDHELRAQWLESMLRAQQDRSKQLGKEIRYDCIVLREPEVMLKCSKEVKKENRKYNSNNYKGDVPKANFTGKASQSQPSFFIKDLTKSYVLNELSY